MFNLYESYRSYNIEHLIAWEAYELNNGLTVKISPAADHRYPFKAGQDFHFLSHDAYAFRSGVKDSLYVYQVTQPIREQYPEVIKGLDDKGSPKRIPYAAKVVKVKELIKVINLDDPKFDFDLLNFTLNGAPLFAELLIFMMKEISEFKKLYAK